MVVDYIRIWLEKPIDWAAGLQVCSQSLATRLSAQDFCI